MTSDDRRTPATLYRELDEVFGFDWDLAADKASALAPFYFGPDHETPEWRDALAIPDWVEAMGIYRPTAWLNPPYSRGLLSRFLAKVLEETGRGLTTVVLLPGDTSTKWFHDLVWEKAEVHFQRGRNAFEGAPLDQTGRLAPAKFGSILAVYRPCLPPRWR